jgi:di/tricarboxylate transporter
VLLSSLLVMGGGVDRAIDYIRVGTPLIVMLLVLLALLIPVFSLFD